MIKNHGCYFSFPIIVPPLSTKCWPQSFLYYLESNSRLSICWIHHHLYHLLLDSALATPICQQRALREPGSTIHFSSSVSPEMCSADKRSTFFADDKQRKKGCLVNIIFCKAQGVSGDIALNNSDTVLKNVSDFDTDTWYWKKYRDRWNKHRPILRLKKYSDTDTTHKNIMLPNTDWYRYILKSIGVKTSTVRYR